MSNYHHLFKELPLKCEEILNDSFVEDKTRAKNREVTHMLVLASVSIILPMERLDDKHPSKEFMQYSDSYEKMKALRNQKFLKSDLYEPNVWFYDEWLGTSGLYENQLINLKPIEQHSVLFQKSPNQPYSVEQFLKHLRNALAHGHIFFRGEDEIEELVFVTKKPKKMDKHLRDECLLALQGCNYRDADLLRSVVEYAKEAEGHALLMTSPMAFHDFLTKWFDFVRELEYPSFYAEAAD